MKILITGATGFVGRVLLKALQKKGHEITVLTRSLKSASSMLPVHCNVIEWKPSEAFESTKALEGMEAVIHLAGENIAGGRWTKKRKTEIDNSRILSTRNLVQAMGQLETKPRVFVSASAVGIYGDAGDRELSESSRNSEGYLADVCRNWEEEIFKAQQLEIRTVALRTGVVLGKDGGAMEKMLPPFKMGLGGPLANGRQWMSWIHILDLVHMYVCAVENDSLRGIYNAVSPQPVRNLEFTKTLGKYLKRPTLFRVPAIGLKILLGEMAQIVLASQKVSAKKISGTGFTFGFPDLNSALKEITDQSYHLFEMEQWIPQPLDKTFSFFKDAKNLELLTPDFLNFKVLKQSTQNIQEGTRLDYRLSLHGFPMRWQSKITDWNPNSCFSDIQVKGPYSHWYHTHEFEEKNGGTLLRDRIRYTVPFGPVGEIAAHDHIRKDLKKIFGYRRDKIEELFG